MFKKVSGLVIVVAGLIIVSNVASFAAVPKLISFQGQLANADGTPVTGTQNMTFTFYDSVTGGKIIKQQTIAAVFNVNGIFKVELDITGVVFSQSLWMATKMEGDEEMTPRIRILPSAAAIYSANADNADNAVKLNGQSPSYYLDYNNLTNVPASGAANIDIQVGGVSKSSPTAQIDFSAGNFNVTGAAGKASVNITSAPYAVTAGTAAYVSGIVDASTLGG
ncbi:MAG: hypothetical protein P9M06_01950, partial [Candidatus Saelkia tenebricola]|nr:hypothetical protein [Candidatus Saelkia tenebricola]